ncbi:MAG TPA: BON domain-containing protein [Terriglobales bacterium]|nr:BON domain-containing protein [Terriglobales bacterium]
MNPKLALYLCTLLLAGSLGLVTGCSRAPNDAQVAGNVQSKIYADPNVQSRQITVQSANGVVTLSGYANSDAERATAAADAAQIEGVKTVVNNLEVSAPAQAAAPAPAVEPAAQQEEPPPAPAPERRRAPRHRARRAPAEASNTSPSNDMAMNSAPAAPAPAEASIPAPPPPPKPVVVPAGTNIAIRLIEPIDSEKNQTGQSFRATLDSPLADENGNVVVPAGFDVTGRLDEVKSAGRFAGQSDIILSLTRLSVNGRSYSLQTNQYSRRGSSRGKATAAKVGGGAAIGAILGGLLGGGKGAAVGATVGAGAGTGVSAATKGQQIVLPSETVLNFQLQAPVSVIPTEHGPNSGRQQLN